MIRERIKRRLVRFVDRSMILFAAATRLREVLLRKDPVPYRAEFPGRDEYLADYLKWHALRSRIIVKDEERLRRLALENCGTSVWGGPFSGMRFRSCECDFSASRILGTYEAGLHPYLEAAIETGYDVVLNPGCANGYYAVGMALRMPRARVVAWDLDPEARGFCEALARENGVDDRLSVRGRFGRDELKEFAGSRVLMICDIEGGESELLDPVASPELSGFDIIVELHDIYEPGTSDRVPERFKHSHDVTLVHEDDCGALELPSFLKGLGGLERYIACHGGSRWGPTPWAVMTRR